MPRKSHVGLRRCINSLRRTNRIGQIARPNGELLSLGPRSQSPAARSISSIRVKLPKIAMLNVAARLLLAPVHAFGARYPLRAKREFPNCLQRWGLARRRDLEGTAMKPFHLPPPSMHFCMEGLRSCGFLPATVCSSPHLLAALAGDQICNERK